MKLGYLLALLFVFPNLALARDAVTLSGAVKDPQGRSVSGAGVTLLLRSGGGNWSTTTDSAGTYHFDNLPPGDYLLRASASGFEAFTANALHLEPGAARSLDISLRLAALRNEIVVTASSTPQTPAEVSKAVTVIDRSEADDRGSPTLSDAISLAPSVRVQQTGGPGGFTTVHIRGLRTEDTAVLVDGLRIRDVSATQADASSFIEDLLFTDTNRVEVLRGSGSSLYGTNAIGGVVNVITEEGGGRTRGSVLLEGGSLGSFRARADVSGGWHHDRFQYSLGAAQVYVGDGVDGDDPFRDTNAQGRLTYRFSPDVRLVARLYAGNSFGKLNSTADVLGSPSGSGILNAVPLPNNLLRLYQQGTPLSNLNTANANFIPAPDNPDYTRAARYLSGALILTGQTSPSLDYSVSYQMVANSRRYGDGPAGVSYQPEANTRSLYDGRIQTVNAHLDYRLGAHNLLTGGYEFESEHYANNNTDSSDAAANADTSVGELSHSVFLQDQVRLLGDRLQLSGATRAQWFSLSAPGFLPEASAPYQNVAFHSPTPAYTGDGSAAYFFRKSGTKLRAHLGRGYRAPSMFERFGTGYDPTFGYSVYGDPRLKPEHSTSVDAGIDQAFWGGRARASATYFYTWLQDVITFDSTGLINPATDPFDRFIGYVNAKGGISRGVELSVAFTPLSTLQISAAYTFVNAIERTPIVDSVLQTFAIPRNQFSLVATERLTPRLTLVLDSLTSTSYLAPVYGSLVTQVYRFDGVHRVNLGGSYRLPLSEYRAIRFYARVENLLGQEYFENGFLTPGRTARGGLQFEF